VKYEWLKIPHFVNTPFYVYTYATGMSAAIGLARNIIKIGEPAVQRYFGFLRAGRSQFPLDSLREAGIDMSTPQPIQLAFDNFAETLDLVEAELALSQH
jgi:oligoendopeptidase F